MRGRSCNYCQERFEKLFIFRIHNIQSFFKKGKAKITAIYRLNNEIKNLLYLFVFGDYQNTLWSYKIMRNVPSNHG